MRRYLVFIFVWLLMVGGVKAQHLEVQLESLHFDVVANAYNFVSFEIDGTSDKFGYVLRAPKAGTVTEVGFAYGVRTGTPVEHLISVQSVHASNKGCDGTILGGGSPASVSFTPPANDGIDNSWIWFELDNSIAVTRGQVLCITVEPVGTPDASNKTSWRYLSNSSAQGNRPEMYVFLDTGTVTLPTRPPLGAIQFLDGSMFGNAIAAGASASNFNTPNKRGLFFTLEGEGTFTLNNAYIWVSGPTAGKTVKCQVFSCDTATEDCDNDTPLQEVTVKAAETATTSGSPYWWPCNFTDTLAELSYGSSYAVVLAPQEADTNIGIGFFLTQSDADLAAHPLGSSKNKLATTSGATLFGLTTAIPYAKLIIQPVSVTGNGGGNGECFDDGLGAIY
jgi:hypothetical protein